MDPDVLVMKEIAALNLSDRFPLSPHLLSPSLILSHSLNLFQLIVYCQWNCPLTFYIRLHPLQSLQSLQQLE